LAGHLCGNGRNWRFGGDGITQNLFGMKRLMGPKWLKSILSEPLLRSGIFQLTLKARLSCEAMTPA